MPRTQLCHRHPCTMGVDFLRRDPCRPNIQKLILGMTCQEVQRELSNYLDRELPVEVCAGMEDHVRTCERCAALLQDMRDIVLALGDERLVDVPPGYGTRLYRKLKVQLEGHGLVSAAMCLRRFL